MPLPLGTGIQEDNVTTTGNWDTGGITAATTGNWDTGGLNVTTTGNWLL